MKSVKISIIIPTLNEEKYLEKTLKKLKILKGLNYEIIVADNRSDDKTSKIAKKYADKVIVARKRGNISKTRNLGASYAKGKYFVFLDADVIIPAPYNFFNIALFYFKNIPKLKGLTCPIKVLPEKEMFADKFFFNLQNLIIFFLNNFFHRGAAFGEFQMMRAIDFRKLKGYREDLMAADDQDMFLRLSRLGKTHSTRRLTVFHTGRRAHIVGWSKLIWTGFKEALSYSLFNKSAVKEWEVVR